MRYKYRVRDSSGLSKTGVLEADHKKTVILGLLEQGYAIVDLLELDPDLTERRQLHLPTKVDGGSLALFTRQLAVMLAAGLPILHCLQTLQPQTGNPKLRKILARLVTEVRAGSGLAEAFSNHPQDISPVYVNIIQAGEASGTLDTVLLQLSSHLQKEEASKRKLKAAAAYPIFTSLLALMIMILLVALVLPRFAEIFITSGVSLPWTTRLLLGAGDKMQSAAPYLLLSAGTVTCLLRWVFHTRVGGMCVDYLKLILPLIGPLERKRLEVIFTATLAILLRAGIPILPALEVVADTTGNCKCRETIGAAIRSTSAGDSLAGPLARSGMFQPMLTDMIAVGEATGTLDSVLGQLSEYCETELSDSLENLAKMVEPLLILVVAVIVGAVVVAMLLPMMDMVGAVGL
ncbi:MAG: type II secretion system F family protein [Syntrophomonas sp.]|nr:type II secretion system F family protein [Syntrophomonas sp.]